METKEQKNSSFPKYLLLRDKLKERILKMEFAPGEKLPTERGLAESYKVSRMIIRQAIDELVKNKTLIRFRGRGTFLNPDAIDGRVDTKTKPLGFLFVGPSNLGPSNYLNDDIVSALSQELSENNSHLVTMSVSESSREWAEFPHPIREGIIDGIFIRGGISAEIINMLAEKMPVMQIGNYVREADAKTILPDNMEGIRLAFEHLYNLGHRRIGYFGGPVSHLAYWERLQGYKQALEEHNMIFNEEIAHVSPEFGNTPFDKVRESFKKVTAIICDNENKALSVIKLAHGAGLSVPENMSVTAFDNTAISELASPSLTSVSFDRKELSQLAVQNLREARGESKCKIILPTELIKRESSSALKN